MQTGNVSVMMKEKINRVDITENSISLADKITEEKGDVTLRLYNATGHVKIMKPFISGPNTTTRTVQDIQQFIESHK